MDYAYFIDTVQTMFPWALATLFYLEAGRRSLQTFVLLMPNKSKDWLAVRARTNTIPTWFYAMWFVAWGPFMVIFWCNAQLYKRGIDLAGLDEADRNGVIGKPYE